MAWFLHYPARFDHNNQGIGCDEPGERSIGVPGTADLADGGLESAARRQFMYGLGAVLVSGCGGEGDAGSDGTLATATTSSTGIPATGAGATRAATGATAGSASPEASGSATAARNFTHPGLLHTEADFARMRAKVAAQAAPWIGGWNVLIANGHTSLSRNPNPQAAIYRGNDGAHAQNYGPSTTTSRRPTVARCAGRSRATRPTPTRPCSTWTPGHPS